MKIISVSNAKKIDGIIAAFLYYGRRMDKSQILAVLRKTFNYTKNRVFYIHLWIFIRAKTSSSCLTLLKNFNHHSWFDI